MQSLRKVLTVLFLLMAVLILVGLALPGQWSTEREVRIDAAPADIFPRIADLRQWQDWAVWFEHDPEMETTFSTPSHGVGAHYEWSGNQAVGTGRLDVIDVRPDTSVHVKLDMSDGRFRATGVLELIPEADATRVRWQLGGELGKDPFARLNRTLLQNAVGQTLQASLDNLQGLPAAQ